MSLVNKQDIITLAHLDKVGMQFAADIFMEAFSLNRLNDFYAGLPKKNGLDFLDAAFKELNITCKVDAAELANLPASGPFILVSNHPFGLLDGMLLIRVICEKRPDFKVMANFMLQKIEPISPYFIYVDPFESEETKAQNIRGMKDTMKHLLSGSPLGIFPAGEVSTYQKGFSNIRDKEWNISVLKLMKKVAVPVLPVYFHGSNRLLFHLLGKIHPSLRTVTIPAEMFHKQNNEIKLRIGAAVSAEEQKKFGTAEDLGRYLRARVYALGSAWSEKKTFQQRLQQLKRPQEIIAPVSPALLQTEVESIRHHRLLHEKNYLEVFVAPAKEIPNVLREIGRLREVTFRKIGEGTYKSVDLDEFDEYYEHLFLWDNNERKIVGAYRLGKGDAIYAQKGAQGFYNATLFEFGDAFFPYLKNTLELGRSFVTEEYQKKTFPLFLLWKGIEKYLSANRQYRYLMGTVSISSSYSEISRALLMRFIRRHYFDEKLAALVKVKKEFEVKQDEDLESLLQHFPDNLQEMDKLISEIEPAHFKMPVLLKKYIKQNARIIGFDVDAKFNNCLDGLMLLDLKNLPEDTPYKEI